MDNEQTTDNEQATNYAIKLDIFEGPLDLLLYLIKKNEIDIYNIPIALVTEQYLEYLKMIKALNLDLAGEYLVMASTLIHIKSRMLLPTPEEPEEEEEDPRAELVR
ncbi:MAG: segregation/condensation protein A, partial [Smithella sp.]